MPQYAVIVYAPAPADPAAYTAEYLEELEGYPARARAVGAKVLGGSYFPKQRGFALAASTTAVAARGDERRDGTLVESELVVTAFYVLAAPDIETAVRAAGLHPAARGSGVEVRPLFVAPDQAPDGRAD